MKHIIIAALALLVTGCAAREGKIIDGNSSSVVIYHGGSYPSATQLAAQHCSAYGKNSRLAHTEGWIMSFDCVSR